MIADLLIRFFVITVSLSLHEAAHAWTALRMGDDTAERMGRLSLNPLAHMDPLGSMMILFGMPLGWAKPVPVNPANLRNPRAAMPLVSFAGPLSNLLIGIAGCMVFFIIGARIGSAGWLHMLRYFIEINFALAVFNLLPIWPLDGSKIITAFMSDRVADRYEEKMMQLGVYPLLIIMVFEMVPGGFGIIELWFRFWRPVLLPVLSLFSVPPSFLWY